MTSKLIQYYEVMVIFMSYIRNAVGTVIYDQYGDPSKYPGQNISLTKYPMQKYHKNK